MIVVDANVIAYLVINGQFTPDAEAVRLKDSDWIAPALWFSELLSALSKTIRQGLLTVDQSVQIMTRAQSLIVTRQAPVQETLALASAGPCSAYDCQYVAIAEALNVALVTEDRQVLGAFPSIATSMRGFLGP